MAPSSVNGAQPDMVFNPKHLFVGAFIPNWLLRSTEVSQSGKLVYARLVQYCNDEGKAWPALDVLAVEVGVSPRQCGRVLAELEEIKLLQSRQRGLKLTNEYTFLWHPMMGDTPGFLTGQNVLSGVDKNVQSGVDTNVTSGPDKNVQSLQHRENNNRQEQGVQAPAPQEDKMSSQEPVAAPPSTDLPPPGEKSRGELLWSVFSKLQTVKNGNRETTIEQLQEVADDFGWLPTEQLVEIAKTVRDHYGNGPNVNENATLWFPAAKTLRKWLNEDREKLKASLSGPATRHDRSGPHVSGTLPKFVPKIAEDDPPPGKAREQSEGGAALLKQVLGDDRYEARDRGLRRVGS